MLYTSHASNCSLDFRSRLRSTSVSVLQSSVRLLTVHERDEPSCYVLLVDAHLWNVLYKNGSKRPCNLQIIGSAQWLAAQLLEVESRNCRSAFWYRQRTSPDTQWPVANGNIVRVRGQRLEDLAEFTFVVLAQREEVDMRKGARNAAVICKSASEQSHMRTGSSNPPTPPLRSTMS